MKPDEILRFVKENNIEFVDLKFKAAIPSTLALICGLMTTNYSQNQEDQ